MAAHRAEAGRDPALAVASLIVVTGLVFAYEAWLDAHRAPELGAFISTWGLVPREFLRELGSPGATLQVVWLTPLTAMFVHGSLLHWLSNALFLGLFGRAVEVRLGSVRFAVFYLVCGLAAAAVHLASAPASYLPTVGASGAVSGVLAANWLGGPTESARHSWPATRIPVWVFVGLWIVIQIIWALSPSAAEEGATAWWAHLGGFGVGALISWSAPQRRSRLRS
jgi:membrane associated rhomboid family serine protease